jgi:hypothetical protein
MMPFRAMRLRNGAPPPTDPYFSNVVLLLHMTGANGSTTFTDVKGHTVTANGNAQIVTTGPQIGSGGVGWFDGTGDYLTVPTSTDFGFGTTGDYTVEAYVMRNAVGAEHDILDTRLSGDTAPRSLVYYISATDQLAVYNSTTVYGNTGTTIPINVFRHVAWTRQDVSGTRTTRAFIDGVLQWSSTAAMDLRASRPLVIGANFAFGSGLNGRMKELRITNGVARYTANFTPPVLPFPDA